MTDAPPAETGDMGGFDAPPASDAESYSSFIDGMEAAAQICGSLAETTYDDTDAFEAATGCEAAIMAVVKEKRQECADNAPWEDPLTAEEAAMIDAAWEKHKAAGPASGDDAINAELVNLLGDVFDECRLAHINLAVGYVTPILARERAAAHAKGYAAGRAG